MPGLSFATKRGAIAIEYGFLMALIAIAMLGALIALGGGVAALFGGSAGEVSTAELIADSGVEGSALCDNK